MKTADLIPLILIELSTGDKYGFELTKNIEDRSNQQVQIKQPTLYTVLKKLEKSKFISSYWEDSEIGGKRHYYKITENGKAQLATLPSFDECLKILLANEQEGLEGETAPQPAEVNTEIEQTKPTMQQPEVAPNLVDESTQQEETVLENAHEDAAPMLDETTQPKQERQEEKFVSIMDLISSPAPEEKESIINSAEVFKNDDLDTRTEVEINKSNTEFLKDNFSRAEQQFAENAGVKKFVEVKPTPKPAIEENPKKHVDIEKPVIEKVTNADLAFKDVPYVDYIDFKTKKDYIYAKKAAKFSLVRTLLSSLYIILMLVICAAALRGVKPSGWYFICLTLCLIGIVAYIWFTVANNEAFRIKVQKHGYHPKLKFRLIFSSCLLVAIFVASIIWSVTLGGTAASSMFARSNFSTIYAPILMFSSVFVDLLLTYLFVKHNPTKPKN